MKVEGPPHTGSILKVLTLNINGLRANLRRDLLAKSLTDLKSSEMYSDEDASAKRRSTERQVPKA